MSLDILVNMLHEPVDSFTTVCRYSHPTVQPDVTHRQQQKRANTAQSGEGLICKMHFPRTNITQNPVVGVLHLLTLSFHLKAT